MLSVCAYPSAELVTISRSRRTTQLVLAASLAVLLSAILVAPSLSANKSIPASLQSAIGLPTFQRMQSLLRRISLLSGAAPSAQTPTPTNATSRAAAYSSMTSSTGRNDGAEVNDSPDLWRKELAALPSLEDLGGVLPSIFLAHGS